jgi:hypothetical protein
MDLTMPNMNDEFAMLVLMAEAPVARGDVL